MPAQKPTIKDNVTYYLASVFIGKKKNALCKDKGHIVFNTKLNTAACFTSCNFIQLKYVLNAPSFKFSSIVPDKEPCPDRLIGLESDLKENLPKITDIIFSGKQLIFLNKKDTLVVFYENNSRSK